ncbi:MAG: hypothetical protein HFH45_03950 [Bacilli bacterium]|nr:hypothetical protein [Bacilli bacterium]
MAKKKKENKHYLLKISIFLILFCAFIYAYGTYIEPKQLTVKEYKIENKNLTENFDGFKIIHISDIHYGQLYGKKDLQKLVTKINELNADIIVFTGDLIDKNTKMTTTLTAEIANELKKIKNTSGKYAIKGEEDTKFDEWENIINDSGFINLNNNYDTIYKDGYDSILIAGVSSFNDKESIINKNQKTQNYINSFEKDGPLYNILLIHEPDYIDDLEDNKYNLILAGHSHQGQIKLPLVNGLIYKEGSTKYKQEHHKINNSDLYISNGIGNSKINFRLFNTPAINVYRLVK